MAGINLSSSSVGEKKVKPVGSSNGFLVGAIILLVLLLGGWGGTYGYKKTLEKKLATYDEILEKNSVFLRGEKVNRVADFDARLRLMGEQAQKGELVDSRTLLTALEGLILQEVTLSKYEYKRENKSVTLEGKTDSFKQVARQIISLKTDAMFSEVRVLSLGYDDNGKVIFTFQAKF
ncbi:MAG: hypothetical protein HYV45_01240 [Candidatus Moranbacteria bacterium]|nr:hypothetical protein [Candidatus Moranbacteria bacterium]